MVRTQLKVALTALLGVLLLTGSTALATVGWAGAGSAAVSSGHATTPFSTRL